LLYILSVDTDRPPKRRASGVVLPDPVGVQDRRRTTMGTLLWLGIVFLIIAVLAYALGARGVAGMTAGVGRTLLFVFLVLAVIFAIVGIMQSA
jgi:uncharacterized membrane protein YtjA (UPF0391 family)